MKTRSAFFHGGVFGGLSITTNVIASMLLPLVLAQGPGGDQTKYRLRQVIDGVAHYYPEAEGTDV